MIYIYNKDISNRILKGADFMEIAKIFESGRSQAVRIPKKYRFSVGEVVIQKIGSSLILTPKTQLWDSFLSGVNGFTEDCFDGDRYETPTERDSL